MKNLIKEIPKEGFVIALDGPAGTGKSSTTKRLAKELGFKHVDTGALYRCIAWAMKEVGFSADQNQIAISMAESAKIEFRFDGKQNPTNRVFWNEMDITSKIRTPEVSMMASRISSIPEVRMALLRMQRELGAKGNAILEGRDIGTVIFPDADLKVFLTASLEERAKRRLSELESMGGEVPSFDEIKKQIEKRDHDDSSREVAPLKKADDAVLLDTSSYHLDQVVSMISEMVSKKRGKN